MDLRDVGLAHDDKVHPQRPHKGSSSLTISPEPVWEFGRP